MKLRTLYRPVGKTEYDLIKASGFSAFPPRLEWQPIFYPVLNQPYAEQIADQWNTKDEFSGYTGYVTAFDLPEEYLQKFPVQNVGCEIHNELWVPAEELDEFNKMISGKIRLVNAFFGKEALVNQIKAAFFGAAIGDALGVPVEFESREKLMSSPVKTMRASGTWLQPAGTWSDDSSLLFCTAESLLTGYDLEDIGQQFLKWITGGFWGAHHKVFDVGNATLQAIRRIANGTSAKLSGGIFAADNGNGSLMRIMPILFHIRHLPEEKRYEMVRDVSGITHAHFRSVFSCYIFLEMALKLLNGEEKHEAYRRVRSSILEFAKRNQFSDAELQLFKRLLNDDISQLNETAIRSGGYVLDTLEASFWCLLNTDFYQDAVLKAVNLGEDTDTTACVTGSLAGLLYGYDNIPESWKATIARSNDIENLCEKLAGAPGINKDK